MKKLLLTCSIFMLLGSQSAFAFDGDIAINEAEIRFSRSVFLEGNVTRIYATVSNNSNRDLLGVVRFYGNDRQINGDQAISIFGQKTDDVFIDWLPASFGQYEIKVKIFPFNPELDDPSNNVVTKNILVLQDTDHDGIPNDQDPDDDNDGVPDEEDHFPLDKNEQYDTDGDGIGNNTDPDDDNDDIPDTEDQMPLDPTESLDTDGDGIGNNTDPDDDNDKLSDEDELLIGTDPLNPDTDGDGVIDGEDAFPLDPNEQYDTDGDNIGNKIDTDDDNDGFLDEEDPFPLNKSPIIELENEGALVGVNDPFVFDATPSYDEDGEIISYLWDIDGEIKEGNSVTYRFLKTGKHNVSLTITDDGGESVTSQFQVNVLNLRLYKQIAATLLAILLALLLYFKYIADTKNRDNH